MDKCLDCGRSLKRCRCEQAEAQEVVDVYDFVMKGLAFGAIPATVT